MKEFDWPKIAENLKEAMSIQPNGMMIRYGCSVCGSSGMRCSTCGCTDLGQVRANELADVCGRLRDENQDLLAENATLRRRLEKLENKLRLQSGGRAPY